MACHEGLRENPAYHSHLNDVHAAHLKEDLYIELSASYEDIHTSTVNELVAEFERTDGTEAQNKND